MNTSSLSIVACSLLLIAAAPIAVGAQSEEPFLPIELTQEERGRLDEIGIRHQSTAAPVGDVRNPAEWEPSEGVLVRWPLGIPVSLVAEMSEDVMVTTLVANASQEQSARNSYTSGGVNMANVDFLYAPTNSIWVRDYGPWFVFVDDSLAIVDHVYNRPRPLDDVVPQTLGQAWSLDVYGMDLTHTGGNHMSDGLGMSASTEMVYLENPGMSAVEIGDVMQSYLGNDYTVLNYIQAGGIHHIDCWAKYLGPSKVMVKDVAPSDPTFDDLNERAEFLSKQLSPWGTAYEVVRVFCPSGTYYTNSLILNDKVLVPLFNVAEDTIALQTYADAMPGYEVIGFYGSWASEDALHCRTMGVPDRGTLAIDHVPFHTEDIFFGDYEISAEIVARSGQPLLPEELRVYWSADGGYWEESSLSATGAPNTFRATIPAQYEDALVAYYVEAADASGRVETHPYVGRDEAHSFRAICPNHAWIEVGPDDSLSACDGAGRLLTARLTGGVGPFTYQWTEDGVEIPGATSATYVASGSGNHDYNVRVRGNGCIQSRTAAEDVEISWQACGSAVSTVPDGTEGGTSPLLATRDGNDVVIAWDAGPPGCASPDYHLIWGWGRDVGDYQVSGSTCSLDGPGSHVWSSAPDTGSDWAWFLIVGNDGSTTEGGWGVDSAGRQRGNAASGACNTLTRLTDACLP